MTRVRWACVMWLAAGCGEGDEGTRLLAGSDAGTDASLDAAIVDSGPGLGEAATAICTAGSTQACTCADGSAGSQTCLTTLWGRCVCNTGGVATQRCKAGYYQGEFGGEYWSGVFDFLGTGQSWVPLTVAAIDKPDRPGFAFTLEEQSTNLGGEFAVYRVGDGCLVGAADTGLFGVHPFVAAIRGELDCATGYFEGELDGQYYVDGNPDDVYPFKGPLLGEFLPDTESFANGTWDVEENMTSDNPPGGMGTWATTWTGEVDSAPPLPPECASLAGATP